jgi:hypothetical protein
MPPHKISYCDKISELSGLLGFSHENRLKKILVTSRTTTCHREDQGLKTEFVPASLYCYTVGHNIINSKDFLSV